MPIAIEIFYFEMFIVENEIFSNKFINLLVDQIEIISIGINLTKLVSSTARAVVDTVRTVFIWVFFLIFEPVEGTHERRTRTL